MDQNFTKAIGAWLETDTSQRDLARGAHMLLRLPNRPLLYQNLMANLSANAAFIATELQKYYDFRVKDLTHEEVSQMQEKVEVIAEKRHLQKTQYEEFRSGKRADHDELPDEIQALYVENYSILQRMRELHLRLRSLSEAETTCPGSDRYPFLKELIALDKQLHENWDRYDHYSVSEESSVKTNVKTKAKSRKK